MGKAVHGKFHEVVEAVGLLSLEEREALLTLVQRSIAEEKRQTFYRGVEDAEAEFALGKCRRMTVDEIVREMRS